MSQTSAPPRANVPPMVEPKAPAPIKQILIRTLLPALFFGAGSVVAGWSILRYAMIFIGNIVNRNEAPESRRDQPAGPAPAQALRRIVHHGQRNQGSRKARSKSADHLDLARASA